MKLNNKGYMLVEIIVSFGLAFVIIISLTNLVLKFKDTSQDLFYETKYLKDKTLITRSIMEDLDRGIIAGITKTNNIVDIDFKINNGTNYVSEPRRLEVLKTDGTTKIRYGKIIQHDTNVYEFDTSDISYYEKYLEPTLNSKDIEITTTTDMVIIKIPVTSLYNDKNYNINIFSMIHNDFED